MQIINIQIVFQSDVIKAGLLVHLSPASPVDHLSSIDANSPYVCVSSNLKASSKVPHGIVVFIVV